MRSGGVQRPVAEMTGCGECDMVGVPCVLQIQDTLIRLRCVAALRPALAERSLTSWLTRSEEHTSELQSLMRISYAVFCLKNKTKHDTTITNQNHITE